MIKTWPDQAENSGGPYLCFSFQKTRSCTSEFGAPHFFPTEDLFCNSVIEESSVSVKGKSWYNNCPGLPQFPGKPVKVMKNQ